MTSQQLICMEFARNGYDVNEIAHFMRRDPQVVIVTLKRAANRSCRCPENCRACPLQITCDANYDTVNRLLRRSGRKPMEGA